MVSNEKIDFKKGKTDRPVRTIHLTIVVFALAAWLTGDGADDYKKADFFDYTIHKWLGLGLTIPVILRIIYGLTGPVNLRFSRWVPYTKERLELARKALSGLLLFKLPDRKAHLGISGLIQASGIILFAWMAFTGSLIFFFVEPGMKARGLVHFVMELHEVGESLIPLYLFIHVGAVVIHACFGLHFWRKMFFLKERRA